jgi:putative transcriptional regulator
MSGSKKAGTKKKDNRTKFGRDLEEAFLELAAYMRGEIELESYEVPDHWLTPSRIKEIRRKVARSTKEFERKFRIPARTMEAYEQGRRRPDAAMETLLRVIDREPAAVERALAA